MVTRKRNHISFFACINLMYTTYKAKYLGSGIWDISGKKQVFYVSGFLKFSQGKEYYILVDDEDLILSIVPV